MGKAFRHRRNKSDFFETPYSMTKQLLENEYFLRSFTALEPAQGNGAITKILEYKFNSSLLVTYYDKYTIGDFYQKDFLLENKHYNYIITNPPFSLWDQFVEKAKKVAKDKFAFLGKLSFLGGVNRYRNKLYADGTYNLKTYIYSLGNVF